MRYEDFSVAESTALLRAVFPNYPDTYEVKPTPEMGAFLQTLRAETALVERSNGTKAHHASG